jgi:hypothetical protein
VSNGAGSDNVAVGTGANATGVGSSNTALGSGAEASGDGSKNTATGQNSNASGTGSENTADGFQANASGNNSDNKAEGFNSDSHGNNSSNLASGDSAKAFGNGSANTAYGSHSDASGDGGQNVAIGSRAVAKGAGTQNTAVGSHSLAAGDLASAFGSGAMAPFSNSAAFGAGAVATRINQQVFGTPLNTYTFPGLTSKASGGALTGPAMMVISDGLGNLAAIPIKDPKGGAVNSTTILGNGLLTLGPSDNRKPFTGIATAFAMALAPPLDPDKKFGLAANWGTFQGENGTALSAAYRIHRDIQIRGAFGYGLRENMSGGRVGVSYQW